MDHATSNNSRKSYSVEYLKSFAESCRESPPDINLQELNVELESINSEWTQTSSTSSSVSPGKHPRRRRNRKNASPQQGANSTGVPSTITSPVRRTPDGKREEVTGEAKEIQTRSQLNRSRPPLTPLKLSDHMPWASIADADNEENELSRNSKSSHETSSCNEFYSNKTKQKFVRHPNLVQAIQTSDGGDSSPGSCSSEKKIDLDSLFVKTKTKHGAKPMPAAPTVEDIEKAILTDKETSEGETITSPALEPGSKKQWNDDGDKVASEHILSVLQKKSKPGKSEKELLGELISSNPISTDLSNLDDVLKHYEKIAASDLKLAESESKSKPGAIEQQPSNTKAWSSGLACSSTVVDSMRTSVKAAKPCSSSDQKSNRPSSGKSFQPWYWAPNAFVQSNGMLGGIGGAPLVPQALHALQRLVDHQLHILNSIQGEVTPGMLHERLSRSVLGYPPTGTQLVFTTYLR